MCLTHACSSPIAEFPFYLLIETSGSDANHDEEKLGAFLTNTMDAGLAVDGTVTTEPSKIAVSHAKFNGNIDITAGHMLTQKIWELREKISAGILHDGHVFKYDLSLPLSHFYDIVPATRERMGDAARRVCGYGHIGDANLHLNVSCGAFSAEAYARLEPWVYEYTSALRGSISAEHGIGFMKTKYLGYSKGERAIGLMGDMKRMMDPNGILNPYKVLGN